MPLTDACRICLESGLPEGCPPHSSGQHFACWVGSDQAGRYAGNPKWALILSEPPGPGWEPPGEGFQDIGVFIRSLPSTSHVLWRYLRPA